MTLDGQTLCAAANIVLAVAVLLLAVVRRTNGRAGVVTADELAHLIREYRRGKDG